MFLIKLINDVYKFYLLFPIAYFFHKILRGKHRGYPYILFALLSYAIVESNNVCLLELNVCKTFPEDLYHRNKNTD